MNIKWMSLVAVMVVFSSGCSDSEQDAAKATVANEVDSVVQSETVKEVKTVMEGAINKTSESNDVTGTPNLGEGIPPEKIDSEVKSLVEKISQNSEMTEEGAAKLEQDLKGVFQQIEAERAKE